MSFEYQRKQPSQELFEKIIQRGVNYIDDAIKSHMIENYYLDFKTSQEHNYTNKYNIAPSDMKNYAKAISAFGNSEGGIIIWGVETGKKDEDYAKFKKPISSISNFCSLIEGATSILTSPPHTSVINKVIFEDEFNDVGFLISFIPKSYQRPFQVIHNNDYRYYIRSGSSSRPAADNFIRSLYGKGPQPDVVYKISYPAQKYESNLIKVTIKLSLCNMGETIAKNVNGYFYASGIDSFSIEKYSENNFKYYLTEFKDGIRIGFVANNDFLLGVEQEIDPLVITINLSNNIDVDGIHIKHLVTSDNQMSYRFEKKMTKNEAIELYNSYLNDKSIDVARFIFGRSI